MLKTDNKTNEKELLDLQRQLASLRNQVEQDKDNWVKYQARIHQIFDRMVKACLELESCILNKSELDPIKEFFFGVYKDYIRAGKYNRWVIDRPYGYAGDFYILDQIYQNSIDSKGFERCVDNYFLNSAATVATRTRKEDFKKHLRKLIDESRLKNLRLMDLGCGPCRLEKELLEDASFKSGKQVIIDCVDHDERALDYAKSLLNGSRSLADLNFVRVNAIKLALSKKAGRLIPHKYNIIFSLGFFDYFEDKIAARLICNLEEMLVPGGYLLISNYREADRNPSRIYMQWGIDWQLVYRSEDDFVKLFLNAGFDSEEIKIEHGYGGIMQYCIVRKR